MASALKNLSDYDPAQLPDASPFTFGIALAEWNSEITHALFEGCYETLLQQGARPENIHLARVPGAFELPLATTWLFRKYTPDALISLGCVIKGETSHNEYINRAVSEALMQLSLKYETPCIFGLLTPNTFQQAKDRAGGRYGNKGVEAATTALQMLALKSKI